MLTFIPLAIVMIIGALGVITLKQPVHASLSLVATLLTLAVSYVTLEAHFLATIQVIVYAGAIMVLFLFVIMLLNIQGDTQELAFRWMRPAAYAVGVLAAAGLIISTLRNPSQLPDMTVINSALAGGGPEQVADALFGEFVLSFQLVGVLLLTGILGAVSLVQRRAEEAEAYEQRQAGNLSPENEPALALSSGGGTAVMEPPRNRSVSKLADEPDDTQTLEEAETKPVVREIKAKDAEKKAPEAKEKESPEEAPKKADAKKKADAEKKAEPKKEPKAKAKPKKATAKKAPAKKAKGKYGPERDDLKRISGVGPKLEQLLNENGIMRFEQIAALDEAGIDELNEQLGSFRGRIERDDWITQAKELANE